MRRIYPFFLCLVIISACSSSTDPDDNPAPNTDAITVEQIVGLPTVGGNVTGIALEPGGGVVALIDGALYTIASPTSAPQRMGSGSDYKAFGRAPNGDVYAVTGTDMQWFDQGSDPARSTPLDPEGPLAQNRYVISASVTFSPSGEVFISMINNSPRMFTYRSSDNGTTWREVTMDASMTAIAFGPNGKLYGTATYGFYVSSNEGETWQRKPAVRENYSGTMMVASDGSIYHWLPQTGELRVSGDEGSSFVQLSEFNKPPFYIDIKEGVGGALYALASKGAQLAPGQPTTLSRSTDRGVTWSKVLNANGRALAIFDSKIAIGLGGDNQQLGGVYWSTDAGTTWSASGVRNALLINDIAFDRNGNLLALIDNALFRRVGSAWQLLGSQGRNYVRVAANKNGAIATAGGTTVYHSTNDGATWNESAIADYIPAPNGALAVPAFIARANGDLLMSLTTYNQSGGGHQAGVLYRIGADGIPQRVTGVGHTFESIVEDRSGKLYGVEQTLDGVSGTFRVATYTSSDASTWTELPSGSKSGAAYNSRNRYVRISSNTALTLGTTGGSEDGDRPLRGFSSTNNSIARMMFGPDDKLYITAIAGGLFATAAPLQ